MSKPRVMIFSPRSTSRVLKFAVADRTCFLNKVVGFITNCAFSMSWARGQEK